MTSTTKRAKCLSGSHSSTDGGRRYPVARSIVRKLLTSAHPETKKGRINVSILPAAAQCAKSDRLLGAPIKSRTCIEHCNPTSALLQFFSNFNGGTRGTDLLLIPRAPGFLVRSEALPSEGRCRRFESSRACQLFQ